MDNNDIKIAFDAFIKQHAPDVLTAKRKEAFKAFETKGFPSKKLENWKYTSLKAVLKPNYSLENSVSVETLVQVKTLLDATEANSKLVFINGVFQEQLSDNTTEINIFSDALKANNKQVNLYFNTISDNNEAMVNLNTAFASSGAFISIKNNKVVEKPIELLFFSSAKKPMLQQPRNLIIVGENTQVNIIEKHVNLGKEMVLTNTITELFAAASSQVHYTKLQNDGLLSNLVNNTSISQQKNSIVTVNTFSFGGKFTRNNLIVQQNGSHCDSVLNGLSILDGKQFVDNHTLVNHNVPDCESHELYNAIYDEKSTGVFNGQVIVKQAAQKTNAYQQNKNILLSDTSNVYAKPQLEIFADDVKCSHGCTVGQLDETALFYMQQRGIPKTKAKALLLYAFANENVKAVKTPALRNEITHIITSKLGVSFDLDV